MDVLRNKGKKMQKNIEIVELDNSCTGCEACANICPVRAIVMAPDEEGFFKPTVNKEKCTNCGLCQSVCSAINFKSENLKEPQCYAAMADDSIRNVSSSGGVFTILANYVFEKNGYVCGAAFDEEWKVKHIIIDNKDDLQKLRGSKYVQSEMGDIYKQIKSLLLDNKLVLFTGTPCQVSALKLFLVEKYKSLITVDLLCHGVPSYFVFRKYLEESFDFDKIIDINFRDKFDRGWRCDDLAIRFSDSNRVTSNDYFKGFHTNLYLRNSCTSCKYASMPRQGDLTLGDFWNIEKYRDDLNDVKGTSLVLTNTEKGIALFQNIKQNLKHYELIPLDFTLTSNPILTNSGVAHVCRERIFELLKKYPFKKALDLALYNKYDVAIIGLGFASNYGDILTNYAMFEFLKSFNLAPLMIDKPKMMNGTVFNDSDYGNTMGRIFMNKYLEVSDIYNDNKDLVEINDKCDIFIVASGQNWRPYVHDPCHYYYFLDWVFDCKKKIAYGTSFGTDEFDVEPVVENNTKYFLNKFDYVSTREDSGVDICKKQLGVDAVQVLDPVFVVNPNVYDKLLEQSELNKGDINPYVATYILDSFIETEDIVNNVKQKFNLPVYGIVDALKSRSYELKETPEDFLAYFKNASFIVTDSFHGVCFSIIFNKPFICIPNKFRGLTRFTSLLSLLGLTDRMVQTLNELKEKEYLFNDMDYSKVNEILKEQKEFSINWLKNAILAPKKHIFSSFDYLNQKIVDEVNVVRNQANEMSARQDIDNAELYRQSAELREQSTELREQTTELYRQSIELRRQSTELREQTTELFSQSTELFKQNNLLKYKILLLFQKDNLVKKYFCYKMLRTFSFGKKRKCLSEKIDGLRQVIDDIKFEKGKLY